MSQFQRTHLGSTQLQQEEQVAIPDIDEGAAQRAQGSSDKKPRFQMKGSSPSGGRTYHSRNGYNAVELRADSPQQAAMKEVELRQAVMRAAMRST